MARSFICWILVVDWVSGSLVGLGVLEGGDVDSTVFEESNLMALVLGSGDAVRGALRTLETVSAVNRTGDVFGLSIRLLFLGVD